MNITLDTVLLKHEFSKPKKIIRQTLKNIVFVASKKRKNFLLKFTTDEKFFTNLKNEVEANIFINKITPSNQAVTTPESKLIINKQYTLAIFNFIHGQNLADQTSLKIKVKPNKQELEQLYQLQKQFYSIYYIIKLLLTF